MTPLIGFGPCGAYETRVVGLRLPVGASVRRRPDGASLRAGRDLSTRVRSVRQFGRVGPWGAADEIQPCDLPLLELGHVGIHAAVRATIDVVAEARLQCQRKPHVDFAVRPHIREARGVTPTNMTPRPLTATVRPIAASVPPNARVAKPSPMTATGSASNRISSRDNGRPRAAVMPIGHVVAVSALGIE